MEKVDSLDVTPMIDNEPVPSGELVGDALSIISLKYPSDGSDPERVVKRNSFRDLHRPDISHLDWVQRSISTEEVGALTRVEVAPTFSVDSLTVTCALFPFDKLSFFRCDIRRMLTVEGISASPDDYSANSYRNRGWKKRTGQNMEMLCGWRVKAVLPSCRPMAYSTCGLNVWDGSKLNCVIPRAAIEHLGTSVIT